MIVGVGVDIVQNSRIKKALATHKIKFLEKILANEELVQISKDKISIQHLAGIFAAKEAVIKSLSPFLGFSLNFQEIIIKNTTIVVPKINSTNVKLIISISHEKYYSIALAIAEIT